MIPKNTEVFPMEWQKVLEYEKYKIVELYISTQKLETSKRTIQYIVKNNECKEYSYKFFKQPWIKKYNINFSIFGTEQNYVNISSDFELNY